MGSSGIQTILTFPVNVEHTPKSSNIPVGEGSSVHLEIVFKTWNEILVLWQRRVTLFLCHGGGQRPLGC